MLKSHNRFIMDRINALHLSCVNVREIKELVGPCLDV